MTEGRGRGVKALESGWHGFWRLPWTMSLASGTWAPVTPPGSPLSLVKLSSHPALENSPKTLSVEGCPTQKRVSLLPGGSRAHWVICEGILSPSQGLGSAQIVSSWLFSWSSSSLVTPAGISITPPRPLLPYLEHWLHAASAPKASQTLCPALASVLDKTYMLLHYRFFHPWPWIMAVTLSTPTLLVPS